MHAMAAIDGSAEPRANGSRRWLVLVAVLLAVLPVLLHGITHGEFFENTDEPAHAVGGLFMADVVRDWPITHPMQYAYRWYAHYPALGLVHWPPFFYLVEAIFFMVLGPSALAARLAVVPFALLGLYF